MKQQQRLVRPVLVLLLAAAVLVFGLAWAMDAAGAASESPTPTLYGDSASPAAGASAAAGKVVYKVGWTREPDNLSPFVGYAAPSFEIWYLTYDSLVGYDPKTLAPMKGESSTGLATDWSVSDDGLTWTFTIRKNAKWSDGVPLTAKDVAFTYNYIIKNQMDTLTAYTRLIDEAVAVDDYTVKMICSKPKPDMIRSWVPILPEHIWSKVDPKQAASGKYTNNPPYVGSGPFQAVEWKKTLDVKLVKNPTWWGPKPKIDEIYFLAYTNNDTLLQDLRAGTIDAGRGPHRDPDEAAQDGAGHHGARRPGRRLQRHRLQLLHGTQPRQPGAARLEVPPGAQLGHRPRQDRLARLGRHHHARHDHRAARLLQEPRLALAAAGRPAVHVRSGEGQAAARRGRLQGHRRRRRARVQGQAHHAHA